MKKILVPIFSFLISVSVWAQPSSTLAPVHVFWRANNTTVFLPTALKKGITTPDSLTLVMLFSKEDIQAASKNKPVELEFQWYRYASTTRFFAKTQKVTSYSEVRNGKFYVAYKSSMKNLRRGWWEVQVISYSDNGFINFRNSKKFQILLK